MHTISDRCSWYALTEQIVVVAPTVRTETETETAGEGAHNSKRRDRVEESVLRPFFSGHK